MANKERGEYALVVGEKRYMLRLTTNACAELEDFANGRTIDQVMLSLNATGSRRDLRLLLWAALRDKHPDLATDDKACLSKTIGPIIDDAGGPAGILAAIRAFIDYNSAPVDLETKIDGGKAGPKPVDKPDPSGAQARAEDAGGASSEMRSRSA